MHEPEPLIGARRCFSLRLGTNANAIVEQTAAGGALVCGLSAKETLLLGGVFCMRVLRGQVHVAGATLTAASPPLTAYAPDVYPSAELLPTAEPAPPSEQVPRAFTEYDVVVRVESVAAGIEHTAQVCPVAGADPFGIHAYNALGTFSVLGPDARADALRLPEPWVDLCSKIAAQDPALPLSVLVRGAKNTGKSTLVQCLANTLLSPPQAQSTASRTAPPRRRFVALLDVDLGQPMLGPPGFVALHVLDATQHAAVFGPAWCLPRVPLRSYYVGDVSPRDEPERFTAAVRDLAEYFCSELQYAEDGAVSAILSGRRPAARRHQRAGARRAMPLLVNTHGWVKGLGMDLVAWTQRHVQPTHVVELGGDTPTDAATEVHAVPAFEPDVDARARRINAAESRTLSTLAYLHATRVPGAADPQHSAAWDFATPLLARAPFEVTVPEGLPGGLAVLPSGAEVDEPLSLLALNGALVALCANASPEPPDTDAAPSVWHAALRRGQTLLAPAAAPALALALVRAIDRDAHVLQVLTPLSPAQLAALSAAHGAPLAAIKGALELPVWGALDHDAVADVVGTGPPKHGVAGPVLLAGVPRAHVPYLVWPPELLGAAAEEEGMMARPRKVRRNLMRRSQVRG